MIIVEDIGTETKWSPSCTYHRNVHEKAIPGELASSKYKWTQVTELPFILPSGAERDKELIRAD